MNNESIDMNNDPIEVLAKEYDETPTSVPEVSSDEYVDYIENRYNTTHNEIIRQLVAHEISNDEFARRLLNAILDYNTGMREHVNAIEKIEEEEAALAEFDSDLKEQLRIKRVLNAKIKERIRQLKEEQRNARLRQQLEKETQINESLREQLSNLEGNGQKSLH